MDQWADWYSRHRLFVRKSACILLGNSRWADDVVQEVFLRLSQSASHYRGESSETTYLWGVARNVCREFTRREIRERRFREQLERQRPAEPHEPSPSSDRADDAQTLSKALAQLRPRHREPLLLYYYHDRSYAEIAKVLGIPEGTVKSRIHQARERLSAVLGNDQFRRGEEAPQ